MTASKGNGLDAPHDQPAKDSTNNAADFKAKTDTIGGFPTRHDTVTAEVLVRLLRGDCLTGMDAVTLCNTTRLAATIYQLGNRYGWSIDRGDLYVGTADGRVSLVKIYYLRFSTINKAYDAGAREFCRSVTEARAKTRMHANNAEAKAKALKLNVARVTAKRNPHQGQLSDGGANA